jgi:hypothetical protein
MHYQTPHWFESMGSSFPWIIPLIAIGSLWLARISEDRRFKQIAERAYFGLFLLVGWGTLRTIISNESCWIIHTSSMAAMIVGAVFPCIGEYDPEPSEAFDHR